MKKTKSESPKICPLTEMVELAVQFQNSQSAEVKTTLVKKITQYNKTHGHAPLNIRKVRALVEVQQKKGKK